MSAPDNAPMILTLTPNAALDRILFVDEIKPGATMRCSGMIDHIGGKGLDASIALRMLDVETVGITFAAGATGQTVVRLVEGYGIRPEVIWLEGETRIAHVVVETKRNRHSHIIAGSLPVPPHGAQAFIEQMRAHLPHAAWVVAGGSLAPGLPQGWYADLAAVAHAADVPVLFDISGPPALATLDAPPAVLKMNQHEFEETFGTRADGLEALAAEMLRVARECALPALVLTCGEAGILAATPEGAFHVFCPPQVVYNAAGAGDSASAALVWRLALGDSWREALRWAAAVSAASVLSPLTAVLRREDADRLLHEVTIRPLPPLAA